jgi:hypothetical protein
MSPLHRVRKTKPDLNATHSRASYERQTNAIHQLQTPRSPQRRTVSESANLSVITRASNRSESACRRTPAPVMSPDLTLHSERNWMPHLSSPPLRQTVHRRRAWNGRIPFPNSACNQRALPPTHPSGKMDVTRLDTEPKNRRSGSKEAPGAIPCPQLHVKWRWSPWRWRDTVAARLRSIVSLGAPLHQDFIFPNSPPFLSIFTAAIVSRTIRRRTATERGCLQFERIFTAAPRDKRF